MILHSSCRTWRFILLQNLRAVQCDWSMTFNSLAMSVTVALEVGVPAMLLFPLIFLCSVIISRRKTSFRSQPFPPMSTFPQSVRSRPPPPPSLLSLDLALPAKPEFHEIYLGSLSDTDNGWDRIMVGLLIHFKTSSDSVE
jgi:hypothetical protein